MKNYLRQRREELQLTIDELADKEDVHFNTVYTLERGGGVNQEKPRAMRMLIHLNIPYIINDRGSICVNNREPLPLMEGDEKDMVQQHDYFDGMDLGNGVLQQSSGIIYYNELRDALDQTNLSMEEVAEKFSVPFDSMFTLASGQGAIEEDETVKYMLDTLGIRYGFRDNGRMYINRNFKLHNDDELTRHITMSHYKNKDRFVYASVKETKESSIRSKEAYEKEEPLDVSQTAIATTYDENREEMVQSDMTHTYRETESNDSDLLTDLKTDLKWALKVHEWSDTERQTLKQAFQAVGMKQLEEEIEDI